MKELKNRGRDVELPLRGDVLVSIKRATTVNDAVAKCNGRLELVLNSDVLISIESTTGFEAWHFRFPIRGTAAAKNAISLHGAAGRLI